MCLHLTLYGPALSWWRVYTVTVKGGCKESQGKQMILTAVKVESQTCCSLCACQLGKKVTIHNFLSLSPHPWPAEKTKITIIMKVTHGWSHKIIPPLLSTPIMEVGGISTTFFSWSSHVFEGGSLCNTL